jgi:RNA polymerase sigma factor (sigma-70 family)
VSVGASASDGELATAAAAGNDTAYAELVRRYKEPLYRLLRSHCGDAEEAYEAVQEAFIAAWQALARYDAARSFSSWLHTIALNKARDRARRRWVRRLVLGARGLDGDEVESVPDPAPDAQEALLAQERDAQVEAAIARLPGTLKEALILTAIEGLTQAEAAAVLGVSPKTIEMRTYRARRILSAQLDPALLNGNDH